MNVSLHIGGFIGALLATCALGLLLSLCIVRTYKYVRFRRGAHILPAEHQEYIQRFTEQSLPYYVPSPPQLRSPSVALPHIPIDTPEVETIQDELTHSVVSRTTYIPTPLEPRRLRLDPYEPALVAYNTMRQKMRAGAL